MLTLEGGRQIVDCISSWWVNLHGHAHPEIASAIWEQAQKLEQVIFAGFTHEPAEQLAGKLIEHLPPNLTRVFYSDNGSTAVEVALKMSYQYWLNLGQDKRRSFIGFEGGYHGDTLGAMSAGGSSQFWKPFQPLMFPVEILPYPQTWESDKSAEEKERQTLDQLSSLLERQSDKYAGIIIEPLVQGAAGMRMCRPSFLRSLREIADRFGVLLIFDEVMTGFGRTGDWFACLKAGASPDIITLSKGISGGFLPLSVTLCSEQIYECFLSDNLDRAFFHGHSYTANPLACAAALASMRLLEANPSLFQNMEEMHRRSAARWLSDTNCLERLRFCGTIAAVDLAGGQDSDYFATAGPRLRARFLDLGFLIRPLGNTIYLMPPYCVDEPLLDRMYASIKQVATGT